MYFATSVAPLMIVINIVLTLDQSRSDLIRCVEALEKVKQEFALVQTKLEAMLEVISGYCRF
jgi:hypothetical protein